MPRFRLILIYVILPFISWSQDQFHPNMLIGKLKPNYLSIFDKSSPTLKSEQLFRLNKENRLKDFRTLNKKSAQNMIKLEFDESGNLDAIKRKYEALGIFEYLEYDFIGRGGGFPINLNDPDDAYFYRQWGIKNNGDFDLSNAKPGADAKILDAWELTKGSSELIVAVLDSGCKLDHPELKNRLWQNTQDGPNDSDDDNNGYIDDLYGWDFANNDNLPSDDYGHGTNVTGIIASEANNQIGYAGVDWMCKIMSCKILDENNFGYYSWWTEAIYYAVDNGADVINMSVGGSSYSQSMKDAVDYAYTKGVSIVACMMNENNEVGYFPAAYENTIAVGSTDPDDSRSNSFPWNPLKGSNYGSHIDLSAPGNYIYGLDFDSNFSYGTFWSGTSQAAPHVTGVISLLLSINPEFTVGEIKSILRNTADDETGNPLEDYPGWDKYHGAGRLNAYNAISSIVTKTNEKAEDIIGLQHNLIHHGENAIITNPENHSLNISVYAASGNFMYRKDSNQSVIELSTVHFPSGIYYIRINVFEKNTSQFILIIQ